MATDLKTAYILGTSEDVNRLDHEWYLGKDVIGINSSYEAAARANTELTEWICHDQYFAFHEWVRHGPTKTRKWVWREYCEDDRLFVFDPRHPKFDSKYRHNNVRFFTLRPHSQKAELTPAVDEDSAVLDDYLYTIFTAISLAVGLGYTDLRLRGVSHAGDYFGGSINCNRDAYYYEMMLIFKKKILPALKALNIPITNETYDVQFKFKDWEMVE